MWSALNHLKYFNFAGADHQAQAARVSSTEECAFPPQPAYPLLSLLQLLRP